MTKNKLKTYLENYKVYFSSREEDNERIYNTIIRLLKLNCFHTLDHKKKNT